MEISQKDKAQGSSLLLLVGAGILAYILPFLPFGSTLSYPFVLLGTWFHETGHGLTALLLGGSFSHLEIFSGGSGLAHISYRELFFGNRIGGAMISAGGLMGPPVAGAVLILAGSRQKASKIAGVILAAALIISALIWVRTGIGFVVVTAIGLLLSGISWKGSATLRQFSVQFVGVQAFLSAYGQLGYLFMDSCEINGVKMTSDVGNIADKLFLPYWFWGALLSVFSLVLLLGSLRAAYR